MKTLMKTVTTFKKNGEHYESYEAPLNEKLIWGIFFRDKRKTHYDNTIFYANNEESAKAELFNNIEACIGEDKGSYLSEDIADDLFATGNVENCQEARGLLKKIEELDSIWADTGFFIDNGGELLMSNKCSGFEYDGYEYVIGQIEEEEEEEEEI